MQFLLVGPFVYPAIVSDLGTCPVIRPLIDNNEEARIYLSR